MPFELLKPRNFPASNSKPFVTPWTWRGRNWWKNLPLWLCYFKNKSDALALIYPFWFHFELCTLEMLIYKNTWAELPSINFIHCLLSTIGADERNCSEANFLIAFNISNFILFWTELEWILVWYFFLLWWLWFQTQLPTPLHRVID